MLTANLKSLNKISEVYEPLKFSVRFKNLSMVLMHIKN